MGATVSEIEQFLARYAEALGRGDTAALAQMWEIPALVLADGGSVAVSSRDQVEEFFSTAPDQYHAMGLHGVAAEAVAIEQLSDQLCSADVRWVGLDEQGRPTSYRELSSYVLRRDPTGTVRVQVAMSLPSRIPAD